MFRFDPPQKKNAQQLEESGSAGDVFEDAASGSGASVEPSPDTGDDEDYLARRDAVSTAEPWREWAAAGRPGWARTTESAPR